MQITESADRIRIYFLPKLGIDISVGIPNVNPFPTLENITIPNVVIVPQTEMPFGSPGIQMTIGFVGEEVVVEVVEQTERLVQIKFLPRVQRIGFLDGISGEHKETVREGEVR